MKQNVSKAFSCTKEFYKKFDKRKIIKQNIKKENLVCFDISAYKGQSVGFF